PRAPGMGADGGEPDAETVRERAQLGATLAERVECLGERLAATGPDLGLRGDQLADEVRLELSALRGGLDLLEAVDETEGDGIEEGEFLLDGHREVRDLLERGARGREQLLVADLLLVAHPWKPRRGRRGREAAPRRSA